jgi:phosphoglycolate phosphatase-like HAD superfamily hydrolase
MLLLLFDIDGTMLGRAAEEHRDALHVALREVHGVDAAEVGTTLAPAGRTDGEIARALLLAAGVTARRIDERSLEVKEACCAAYAALCPPDLTDKLLPGVADLLGWLSGRDDVKLSLVTGNYEPVARMKLLRAGVGTYFNRGQGAFGSDAEDRAALPPLARRRAGRLGSPHPRERTIVIGDTPRDIACARADGLRSFAVATGPFAIDDLTGADAVVRHAGELRPLLESELAG